MVSLSLSYILPSRQELYFHFSSERHPISNPQKPPPVLSGPRDSFSKTRLWPFVGFSRSGATNSQDPLKGDVVRPFFFLFGPKINKNCCNKFPNKQNPKNSRTHGRHSVSKWLSCYSASEQRLKFGLSEVPPGACPLKSGLWRSGKIGGEVASIGDVWETGKIRIAVRNKFMFCIACMCNLYHEIIIWWYGWIRLNHMQELHVTFQFNTSINYIITMFFSHPECTNF